MEKVINGLCQDFIDKLKEWRVNHEVYNKGYHIQIQRIHNFYPSTRTYYNGDTGIKVVSIKFDTVEELYEFIREHTK